MNKLLIVILLIGCTKEVPIEPKSEIQKVISDFERLEKATTSGDNAKSRIEGDTLMKFITSRNCVNKTDLSYKIQNLRYVEIVRKVNDVFELIVRKKGICVDYATGDSTEIVQPNGRFTYLNEINEHIAMRPGTLYYTNGWWTDEIESKQLKAINYEVIQ